MRSPYTKTNIVEVERVQLRQWDTRIIPNFKNIPYEEILRKRNPPSLTYRRIYGDLIQVYKIIPGIDHIDFSIFFSFLTLINHDLQPTPVNYQKKMSRLEETQFHWLSDTGVSIIGTLPPWICWLCPNHELFKIQTYTRMTQNIIIIHGRTGITKGNPPTKFRKFGIKLPCHDRLTGRGKAGSMASLHGFSPPRPAHWNQVRSIVYITLKLIQTLPFNKVEVILCRLTAVVVSGVK